MRRDDLYVADLADTTRAIREYLDSISRAQWDEDRVLRDAVLYRLLLLGEIASALPESLRDRYPDVAWRHIRAFRNLAVHRYAENNRREAYDCQTGPMFTLRAATVKAGDCYGSPSYLAGRNLDSVPPGPELGAP